MRDPRATLLAAVCHLPRCLAATARARAASTTPGLTRQRRLAALTSHRPCTPTLADLSVAGLVIVTVAQLRALFVAEVR